MSGNADDLEIAWIVTANERKLSGGPMFLILAIILGLAWITGFGIFHVASAAIHVLIVLAIISVLLHVVRGKKST
jgi:hypothetical protein